MATITTRVQGDDAKGSPLTNVEVDNNFINLNTAKYESGDDVSLGSGTFAGALLAPAEVRISNVGGSWTADDEIGRYSFYTTDASGTGARELASIRGISEEGGTTASGALYFYTSPYNSAVGERLVIHSNGGLTQNTGGVVLNEYGGDNDFRVESDTNSHALFVDAGNDRVGLFNSSPAAALDVGSGNILAHDIHDHWVHKVIGVTSGNADKYIAICKDDATNVRLTGRLYGTRSGSVTADASCIIDITFFTDGSGPANVHYAVESLSGLGAWGAAKAQIKKINWDQDGDGTDEIWYVLSLGGDYATDFDHLVYSGVANNANLSVLHPSDFTSVHSTRTEVEASKTLMNARFGLGNVDPKTRLHVTDTAVATWYRDTYTTATIEDTEGRLQLVSEDGGGDAAALILTAGAKNWALTTGGPNISNEFRLGYVEVASNTNIGSATLIPNMFSISTGGDVTFNERSADADFRVESNAKTHMFYVDGGSNFVGIGTSATGPWNQTASYSWDVDTGGDLLNIGGAGAGQINLRKGTSTSGDLIGGIWFTNTSNQSDAHRQVAGISCKASAISGSETLSGGELDFWTKPTNGASTGPRMRLSQSGRLSVGTTSDNGSLFRVAANTTSLSRAAEISARLNGSGDGLLIDATTRTSDNNSLLKIVRDTSGTLFDVHLNGNVTVNDRSSSSDFRVESNVNTHLLFADGGSNAVGIQNSAPITALDVKGTIHTTGIRSRGGDAAANIGIGGTRYQWSHENTSAYGSTWRKVMTIDFPGGTGTTWESVVMEVITKKPNTNFGKWNINANHYMNYVGVTRKEGSTLIDTGLIHGADNGHIRLYRVSETQWELQARQGSNNQSLYLEIVPTASSNATLTLEEAMTAGTDAGGTVITTNTTNKIGILPEFGSIRTWGEAEFNEGGYDMDFRVESDANTHMLFVDAGNNRVGIGTGSPQAALHVTDTAVIQGSIKGGASSWFDLYAYGTSDGSDTRVMRLGGGGDVSSGRGGVIAISGNESTNYQPGGIDIQTGSVAGSSTVINNSGYDSDFRVESDTNSNMIFCDAGRSQVNINCGTFTTYPETSLFICKPASTNASVCIANQVGDAHTWLNYTNGNNYFTGDTTEGDGSHYFRRYSSSGYTTDVHIRGSNGYIGVAVTNPTVRIHLAGGTATSGNTGIAAAWNVHSDYRLKENVSNITSAIDTVKLLRPVNFSWIEDESAEATTQGFIAHEIQAHLPFTVVGEKDAVDDDGEIISQAADYSKVVPVLTAALQEALAKIEDLETRIAALETAS